MTSTSLLSAPRSASQGLFLEREPELVNLADPNDALAQSPVHSGDQLLIPRQVSFVRDYVAPFSSIVSAVVSVAYVAGRYFF